MASGPLESSATLVGTLYKLRIMKNVICLSAGIFIVGAKRTAFGTFGGAFRNTSATELQTVAMSAALKEAGVAPEQVDSVVVGQVMSVSTHTSH